MQDVNYDLVFNSQRNLNSLLKEYYEEHKDNIDLTEFYVINGN